MLQANQATIVALRATVLSRDTRIAKLEACLESSNTELIENKEKLAAAEEITEAQDAELLESQDRVTELEESVQQLRKEGLTVLRTTYDKQICDLEAELSQWRGLCVILRKKDERTDDEIRRKAGEEPELRRKVVEWEAKYAELWEESLECVEENKTMVASIVELKDRVARLTEVGRHKYCKKEAEEAKRAKEAEDVWYVCRDVVEGHLCGDRFELKEVRAVAVAIVTLIATSIQELVAHAWDTHYAS